MKNQAVQRSRCWGAEPGDRNRTAGVIFREQTLKSGFVPDVAHYLNTGQRRCYDTAGNVIPCDRTGQDAELATGAPWPTPRFEVHGEEVVDRLTRLAWTRDASLAKWPMPWEEALEWVNALNARGHAARSDWRLPNRRELRSLISHQTRNPALPEGHPFENLTSSWYWTSASAARHLAYAWYLHPEGGRMFFGRKDEDHLVWPCRGRTRLLPATGQDACFDADGRPISAAGTGQDGELRMGVRWPRPRFVAGKKAVLDRLTGLHWMRRADLTERLTRWEEALEAVRHIDSERLGPADGWRLPTINELESLVDARTCDPALPGGHPFTGTQEAYWSSTTSAYEPDWCMALYLDKGAVGVGMKKGRYFSVWPVRS